MSSIKGRYVNGVGKAHKCCKLHKEIFNCIMHGTFNIRLETKQHIDYFTPSIVTKKSAYWFVKILKDGQEYFGWAVRDHKSRQIKTVLEVLTKRLLPNHLKEGILTIEILEKWDEGCIEEWASKMYWFQSFPFSPQKRADSKFVWDTINRINWERKSVLDIGSHYGYFSFEASKLGAKVIGFEPNKKSNKAAKTIRDKIIQQDINFVEEDPGGEFDVILYLSVHHQPDPIYENLEQKMYELKSRANQHLFVELILPPHFPKGGKMTDKEIDKIVGGEILATYKHKVRGTRRIYHITELDNEKD